MVAAVYDNTPDRRPIRPADRRSAAAATATAATAGRRRRGGTGTDGRAPAERHRGQQLHRVGVTIGAGRRRVGGGDGPPDLEGRATLATAVVVARHGAKRSARGSGERPRLARSRASRPTENTKRDGRLSHRENLMAVASFATRQMSASWTGDGTRVGSSNRAVRRDRNHGARVERDAGRRSAGRSALAYRLVPRVSDRDDAGRAAHQLDRRGHTGRRREGRPTWLEPARRRQHPAVRHDGRARGAGAPGGPPAWVSARSCCAPRWPGPMRRASPRWASRPSAVRPRSSSTRPWASSARTWRPAACWSCPRWTGSGSARWRRGSSAGYRIEFFPGGPPEELYESYASAKYLRAEHGRVERTRSTSEFPQRRSAPGEPADAAHARHEAVHRPRRPRVER